MLYFRLALTPHILSSFLLELWIKGEHKYLASACTVCMCVHALVGMLVEARGLSLESFILHEPSALFLRQSLY